MEDRTACSSWIDCQTHAFAFVTVAGSEAIRAFLALQHFRPCHRPIGVVCSPAIVSFRRRCCHKVRTPTTSLMMMMMMTTRLANACDRRFNPLDLPKSIFIRRQLVDPLNLLFHSLRYDLISFFPCACQQEKKIKPIVSR